MPPSFSVWRQFLAERRNRVASETLRCAQGDNREGFVVLGDVILGVAKELHLGDSQPSWVLLTVGAAF